MAGNERAASANTRIQLETSDMDADKNPMFYLCGINPCRRNNWQEVTGGRHKKKQRQRNEEPCFSCCSVFVMK